MNRKTNNGFGVMIMFQCGLILGKKCTILLSDIDNEGNRVCFGATDMQEISVPSFQFHCKPNTKRIKPNTFFNLKRNHLSKLSPKYKCRCPESFKKRKKETEGWSHISSNVYWCSASTFGLGYAVLPLDITGRPTTWGTNLSGTLSES